MMQTDAAVLIPCYRNMEIFRDRENILYQVLYRE